MMRGLEWQAIPTMVELLEIEDVELFVRALIQIREHQIVKDQKDANTRD